MKNIANFMTENKEHPMQNEVDNALELGETTRVSLFKGLTLVAVSKGKGEFIFRSQKNGKRSQIKLGLYKKECTKEEVNNGELDIENAILVAQKLQDNAVQGLHPVKELRNAKYSIGKTVDAIFEKFLTIKKSKVKSTDAIERHYKNDVAPYIGHYPIKQIDQNDIQCLLNRILESGRKSVAEKSLYLCKNLFNYAVSNNICFNVTQKMTVEEHAGGIAPMVGIALADHDLKRTFSLMRNNESTFNESLYYLAILLTALGLRKSELIKSKWSDFDWEERLFHIERGVAKNKVAIAVPISTHMQPIIEEVSKLANGSIYLFPAFKKSKNGHMCLNTINTALKKLLDKASHKRDLGRIQRFTIHDLRRTFRTMLSRIGIAKDIAELCINHRQLNPDDLSNDERYDRYVKIDQRRHACDQVAENIMLLIEDDIVQPEEIDNIIPFRTAA